MIEVCLPLACVVGFSIGCIFCEVTARNKPKTKELPKFDKMSNTELLVLFMAVGEEMERRGMVERMNVTPFDELKK